MLELIRKGTKRQTLRWWTYARVKVGQRAYVPGLGYVEVTAVERLPGLGVLRSADARADGFGSVRALRAALGEMYAGGTAGKVLWRVRFAWDGKTVGAGRRRAAKRGRGRKGTGEKRSAWGAPGKEGKQVMRVALRDYLVAAGGAGGREGIRRGRAGGGAGGR